MIVVKKLHSHRFCNLAEHFCVLDHVPEVRGVGSVLGRKVGNSHVLTADGLVLGKHALGVCNHLDVGHVCRNRNKTYFLAHFCDVLGLVAVKAGKLNAVVSYFLDLLKRGIKILGCVVTDGIYLYSYR